MSFPFSLATTAAMHNLDSLSRFSIPGQLQFHAHPTGLIFAEIDNSAGVASLCLQGAHLTSFRP